MRVESGLAAGAWVAERYRLRYLLGRGGFGEVWLAGDEVAVPPRQVALKLLLLASERHVDARRRERFAREAEILMRVDHPAVVRALDVGDVDGLPFLALEYIDGTTLGADLQARAQNGRSYDDAEVDEIIRELAAGLHAAHEHGIVHRDLKPLNVMLPRDGGVKILDFGVAKLLDLDPLEETTLGRRVGSLLYLSPEQALGLRVDRRSDVFVLATIAYELLTLRRPWTVSRDDQPLHCGQVLAPVDGNAPAALLHRIVDGVRPSIGPARPAGARELDVVLHRAWSTPLEARFATTIELADALGEVLARAPAGLRRARAPRVAATTDRVDSAFLAAARLPVAGEAEVVVRTVARPADGEAQGPTVARAPDDGRSVGGDVDRVLSMPGAAAMGGAPRAVRWAFALVAVAATAIGAAIATLATSGDGGGGVVGHELVVEERARAKAVIGVVAAEDPPPSTAGRTAAPSPRTAAPATPAPTKVTPPPRQSARPTPHADRPVRALRTRLAAHTELASEVAREARALMVGVSDLAERRAIERAIDASLVTRDDGALDRALDRLDRALP